MSRRRGFCTALPRLQISRTQAGGIEITLCDALAAQSCRLLTSTTFTNWQCVATNSIGANGAALFQANFNPAADGRFFREFFREPKGFESDSVPYLKPRRVDLT